MEATVLPQVLVSSESHFASLKQCSIILAQFSPGDALGKKKKKNKNVLVKAEWLSLGLKGTFLQPQNDS